MDAEATKPTLDSEHSTTHRLGMLRDRFEADLRDGRRVSIRACLDGSTAGQDRLFGELLSIELRYRRQSGDQPSAEEYVHRFPEYGQIVGEVFGQAAYATVVMDSEQTSVGNSVSAAARFVDLKFEAQGGLGQVFAARDEQLKRKVALKFIHDQHAGRPEIRQRFAFEAEVTSRLDHPGVVPVYVAGENWDGRPFYAMRFIRGDQLSAHVRQFHQTNGKAGDARERRSELCDLVRHLASAANTLAYAHHRGVAHLDFKPDNVMIGSFGETLVVDWGLAIPFEHPEEYQFSDVRGTLETSFEPGSGPSGSGAGTLPFMSPEQCDGTWGEVGPASDVYALGVTLYNVLTGQLPFRGKDFARDYREPKQEGRFPRPTQLNRGAPKSLEAICLKAMAPRPEDRYAKAKDFATDLERWLTDEPISARRDSWPERLMRWARRHRNWAISIAVSLSVVFVATLLLALESARSANVKQGLLEKVELARQDNLRMSAKYAARTVAQEIDLRLRILEAKAADPLVRDLLVQSSGEPIGSPPQQRLQAWLDDSDRETHESTKADSWFVNDGRGIQLARVKVDNATLGEPFWYRDYFHGEGLDRAFDKTKPNKPVGVRPIREAYISTVYRSKSTGQLMVAFSYPIWADNADRDNRDRDPIGIIGMAVDVGQFKALHFRSKQQQTTTLASLERDAVDVNLSAGMILHHPSVKEMLDERIADTEACTLPRLDSSLVDRLEALRRARRRLIDSGRDGDDPKVVKELSQDAQYQDVLDADPSVRYHAVFEPVMVTWRNEKRVKDPGWVVIVQERNE